MTTEEFLWNEKFETETIETKEINNEIEAELEALYEMSDEEACQLYNVDNKAEAEILIKEYWN